MKTFVFLMVSFIIVIFLGGCYVYTDEPLPPPVPAIIVVPPGTPPPMESKPAPPPAPSGAPSGAIGPPR